ncbi:MAG: alpha-beta hydrolase superfamily lysophospholipase [Paraglaciecola sp.]|jgi:alpha-beta hydrolase superfamily lysophospholipase
MNPVLKTTLIVLFIFLLIGLLVIHFYAPYAVIKRSRNPPNPELTPAKFGLAYAKIIIQTIDSLQLHGFYIPSNLETVHGTIILLHGIGSCKENMLQLAANLSNEGYNTVPMDSRAHGESDGDYITFGYFEKYDVSAIVDYLIQEKNAKNIGIRGASMGGAIALQALEQDKRLQFGIIECTFANLSDVVLDYQKMWLGLESRFLSNYTLNRAAKIGKFIAKDVRPGKSAKNVQQPIFYAHGDADANISVEYGKLIYHNLASKKKELVIVEGARHENLMGHGGEAYWAKLITFLEELRMKNEK